MLLAASVIGIVAVAGGLTLPARLDAIRLGLVTGGLGSVLYGVIQAGDDLGDAGSGFVFIVAAAGLLLVIVSGSRWLAGRPEL